MNQLMIDMIEEKELAGQLHMEDQEEYEALEKKEAQAKKQRDWEYKTFGGVMLSEETERALDSVELARSFSDNPLE